MKVKYSKSVEVIRVKLVPFSTVVYATNTPSAVAPTTSPSRPNDARKAFEDLFKK
jgi:hypothetical protein